MKSLSLILNVVLLVAVAVLFYLHFAGRPDAEAEVVRGEAAPRGKTVIAYINSDSLLSNYALYDDIQKELEQLEKKYQSEYSNRAKGLEGEIMNFQQTAQSMTINQARAREEELMRKRNNLLQYQENLAQQLMQVQAQYNDSLYTNVQKYLKEYGNENDLDVVLTYTKGSGVLFASDSLDITQQVVSGLNQQYEQTKVKPAVKN